MRDRRAVMVANVIRVASAQYRIERFRTWEALDAKLSAWVRQAAAEGAKLLVFPEYASLELAGLVDRRDGERRSADRHQLGPLPIHRERRAAQSFAWVADAIQPLIPRYQSVLTELARRHDVYILGGSLPMRQADGSLTNTALLFAPDGGVGAQEKMVLTRWEREVWNMRGGSEVRVFDTDFGPIGINICYDAEFPVIARRQAEARARIILAPCCCDSLRGYYRVRVGARARALENQAYVVQAPAVGNANWLPDIDRCVGLAGIYSPPDLGPRENGVMAQGRSNDVGWVNADLDLDAIDRIRGGVVIANCEDWDAHLQVGPAVRLEFGQVA